MSCQQGCTQDAFRLQVSSSSQPANPKDIHRRAQPGSGPSPHGRRSQRGWLSSHREGGPPGPQPHAALTTSTVSEDQAPPSGDTIHALDTRAFTH